MRKALKSIMLCCFIMLLVFTSVGCDADIPFLSKLYKLNETTTESTRTTIVIPNVYELDEATTKTLLASKGIIPKVNYIYNDNVAEGLVVKTIPSIGSSVYPDSVVTIYISKGKSYYRLKDAVGIMYNVTNINSFAWGNESNNYKGTKEFYTPYVKEGYLYIGMLLRCTSKYKIEFYCGSDSSKSSGFGTAAINDTFDKSVPIEILFVNYVVDNKGGDTAFAAKIPLADLSVQKPTNIYIKFDFLVNDIRQTFKADFDLSW